MGEAKLVFGDSLGEAAALIAAGVYEMRHLLRVPLTLADDAVALARDVALGVFFSRGPALDRAAVKRLCLEISHKGKGTVGVSTYLSPNALLLLGQEDTLDRFKSAMRDVLPAQTHLRKNSRRWPPLHTPITWQRALPNRAAVPARSGTTISTLALPGRPTAKSASDAPIASVFAFGGIAVRFRPLFGCA